MTLCIYLQENYLISSCQVCTPLAMEPLATSSIISEVQIMRACQIWVVLCRLSVPKTLYNQTLDPCRPLPGLAEYILKVRWRWKLQRLCRTAGLYSELSSCDKRCNPAVEEEDYEVMYSIDGIHKTFNIRYTPSLQSSLLLSGLYNTYPWALLVGMYCTLWASASARWRISCL